MSTNKIWQQKYVICLSFGFHQTLAAEALRLYKAWSSWRMTWIRWGLGRSYGDGHVGNDTPPMTGNGFWIQITWFGGWFMVVSSTWTFFSATKLRESCVAIFLRWFHHIFHQLFGIVCQEKMIKMWISHRKMWIWPTWSRWCDLYFFGRVESGDVLLGFQWTRMDVVISLNPGW